MRLHASAAYRSRFINGLKKAEVEVDRKILADIAVYDKKAFAELAEQARANLTD